MNFFGGVEIDRKKFFAGLAGTREPSRRCTLNEIRGIFHLKRVV